MEKKPWSVETSPSEIKNLPSSHQVIVETNEPLNTEENNTIQNLKLESEIAASNEIKPIVYNQPPALPQDHENLGKDLIVPTSSSTQDQTPVAVGLVQQSSTQSETQPESINTNYTNTSIPAVAFETTQLTTEKQALTVVVAEEASSSEHVPTSFTKNTFTEEPNATSNNNGNHPESIDDHMDEASGILNSPEPSESSSLHEMGEYKEESSPTNSKEESSASTSTELSTGKAQAPPAGKTSRNRDLKFRLGLEGNIASLQKQLSTSDPLCQPWIDKRKAEENNGIAYSLGLDLTADYKNILISTGVHFTGFSENIAYEPKVPLWIEQNDSIQQIKQYAIVTDIDTSWQILGINQGKWRMDTTWTIVNDTVWNQISDTTLIQVTDSSILALNGTRTTQYVEIPLLIGYAIDLGKTHIDLQTGVHLGILTQSTGARYLNKDLSGPMHNEQVNTFLTYWRSRIGIRQELGQHLQLALYGDLKMQVNNALSIPTTTQRFRRWGITLGLYYQF